MGEQRGVEYNYYYKGGGGWVHLKGAINMVLQEHKILLGTVATQWLDIAMSSPMGLVKHKPFNYCNLRCRCMYC